jgi:hypothetical protein
VGSQLGTRIFFRFARKADKTRPSALDGARGKDALLLK